MLDELTDFKTNRTIEAYFSRFQKIPNPEDRKRLISMIDQFLVDGESDRSGKSYGIKDQSAGAELILEGLEEPSTLPLDYPESSTLEKFERGMSDTLKEVKQLMRVEAESVRRLTEKNIRERNALTGGKVPMRDKGSETMTWSVIEGTFQSLLDNANHKLHVLQVTSDEQVKKANALSESRARQINVLEQKLETLE